MLQANILYERFVIFFHAPPFLVVADGLDFYRELRKAMKRKQNPQSQVVTLEMFENPAYLADLANRLKKVA